MLRWQKLQCAGLLSVWSSLFVFIVSFIIPIHLKTSGCWLGITYNYILQTALYISSTYPIQKSLMRLPWCLSDKLCLHAFYSPKKCLAYGDQLKGFSSTSLVGVCMQSKLKSSSTDLTQADAQMNSSLYAFYIFQNFKTLLCSVAQIKLTFYGWCLQLCMHSCWMWRLNRKNSLVQLSGSTSSACMHVCIVTLNQFITSMAALFLVNGNYKRNFDSR